MSRVGRALLAAVAVSYLMCVLLLSGMQKEDLDARMLNKLERHNVNIHDLNDKKLLSECFTNNSDTITDDPKKLGINNEFIKENYQQNDNFTTLTSIINRNAQTLESSTNTMLENNNNKNIVKYIEGQPEIESVIKFWQDIKIPKNDPSKITDQRDTDGKIGYDQKNKRNVPDGSNSYETDSIKQLLANYLLRKESRTTLQTTEKHISINEFYKDFFGKETNSNGYYNNDTTDFRPNSIMSTTITAERIKSFKTNDKTSNFNDVLNAINTLKTYYTLNNDKIDDRFFSRKNEPREEFSKDIILKQISISTTTEKVETSTINKQNIPNNMIQEIAKSVKELVLKDLRKEMLQLTTRTSFTTVTSTTVTTQKSNTDDRISDNKGDQISEQSILNKFIDLFQEIKSLNRKTVIISTEIGNEKKVTSHDPNMQTYPVMPLTVNGQPMTSYGINHYANFKIQKMYDFLPQIHKFRSKMDSRFEKLSMKSTQPITFQTNNIEIPPLGIPVDKHELPLNQNIIVSTITPYRIGDYNFGLNKIKHPNSKIDRNEFIHVPNTPLKTTQPRFYQFNQNVEISPLYSQSPYFNRIKNKKTSNRGDDNGNRNPKIPRFHEELEKSVDYPNIPEAKEKQEIVDCCNERFAFSKQMVDCCNHKVASRQQMSLNAMKKQSYDDTHFKNFLKSQQKVTDMLERVLASRSRVKSVEMT